MRNYDTRGAVELTKTKAFHAERTTKRPFALVRAANSFVFGATLLRGRHLRAFRTPARGFSRAGVRKARK
jgi:hypothetical protein